MEGDLMKMREALESADSFIVNLEIEPYSHLDEVASELRLKINAALSAPPRNCDVGTVKEQEGRFHSFCDSHHNCRGCQLKGEYWNVIGCSIAHGQMPYESEARK